MYKPDIKRNLPFFVYSNDVLGNLYDIQEDLLNKFIIDYKESEKQLFINTATFSLEDYEKFLGIKTDFTKDEVFRKAAIKARLTGVGTLTKSTLQKIIDDFGYGESQILDNFSPNVVKVRFTNEKIEKDFLEIMEVLNDIIPAHILIVALTKAMTWAEIENASTTFEKLDASIWDDFIEENAITATGVKTTFLRLLTWVSKDIVNKVDFNYNFTRLDNVIATHTHDFTIGRSISVRNILYDDIDLKKKLELLNAKIPKDKIEELQKLLISKTNGVSALAFELRDGKQKLADAMIAKGLGDSNFINWMYSFSEFEEKLKTLNINRANLITATPKDVMKSKTYIDGAYLKAGTMEAINNRRYTADYRQSVKIDDGTHDGTTSISAESDLLPQNVRKGATIWGVKGVLKDIDVITNTSYTQGLVLNEIRRTIKQGELLNVATNLTDRLYYNKPMRELKSTLVTGIDNINKFLLLNNTSSSPYNYKTVEIKTEIDGKKYIEIIQASNVNRILVEEPGATIFCGMSCYGYVLTDNDPAELIAYAYYSIAENQTKIFINNNQILTLPGKCSFKLMIENIYHEQTYYIVACERGIKLNVYKLTKTIDNAWYATSKYYMNIENIFLDYEQMVNLELLSDGYGRVFGKGTDINGNNHYRFSVTPYGGIYDLTDLNIEDYKIALQDSAIDRTKGYIYKLVKSQNASSSIIVADTILVLDINTLAILDKFEKPLGENVGFKQIVVDSYENKIYLWSDTFQIQESKVFILGLERVRYTAKGQGERTSLGGNN